MHKLSILVAAFFSVLSQPLFSHSDRLENFFENGASAGVVDRELEREFGTRPITSRQDIPLLELDLPDEQFCLEDDETVSVDRLEFLGNEIFSQWELQYYLSNYCGQELSMYDLQCLCVMIQDLYVRNGYFLARAYLPEQEVKDGLIVVKILEGTLGKVKVRGNCHHSEAFIYSYLNHMINRPIQYDQFIQAMLLLNDNPYLEATAVFTKGESFGCADLCICVNDEFPMDAYFDYNNFGSHHTPKHRGGLRLDYGNLLKYGDLSSVIGVVGLPVNKLRFAEAYYYLPICSKGMGLEFQYLRSDFHVGKFARLDIKGLSEISSISYTQALLRRRNLFTDLYVEFDYKRIKNFVLHKAITSDNLRVLSAGYTVDYTDGWCGRNLLDFSVSLGIPKFLDGSEAVDPVCSRPGGGGRFFYGNLDYTRIQKLPYDIFFVFNFSSQCAAYKLPLSEQFYIGGWDTVRGYHTAKALGDHGFYTNLELRMPLPFVSNEPISEWFDISWKEFLQVVAFLDHGTVYLKKTGPEPSHTQTLTGAGFGFRMRGPTCMDISFDVGFPLGDHLGESPVYYFKLSWELT